MAKKIYFSPSDQRHNAYAWGNTTEAEQCRKIALAAVEAAKRCGFEAKTDTTTNGDTAMDKRIKDSNAWGADAHIPIHTNAFNGKVAGTRLFCSGVHGKGYPICKAMMAALAPITPGTSDSVTQAGFAEIARTTAPACYIEVGFHDNPEEAKWIVEHTADIAEAIVKGLCGYYGMPYAAPGGGKPAEPQKPADKPQDVGQMYRIRKTWADAKSQAGAYKSLDNAKRACPVGYKVYDEEGKAVYTPERSYTVKHGDTLWDIAAAYLGDGRRYPEIVERNALTSHVIYTGQKLILPE